MDIRQETQRLTASAPDVARAAAILRAGGLVAIPTETVYGLAANAMDPAAVEGIFRAKCRPHWDPLIVHVGSLGMLHTVVAEVGDASRRLMEAFWPGPLTLLLPRRPEVPDSVTAGRALVGVRMPSHPVAAALLAAAAIPLAAPSANRFGHVSPTTADHVLADLNGTIDAVLDAGPCEIGVESTVAEVHPEHIVIYRSGGIGAAQLEHATGLPARVHTPVASGSAPPQSMPSPGVGMRHYATRARIRLVASQADLNHLLRSEPALGAAAILLPSDWQQPNHTGPVWPWAASTDAAGLAESLYRGLRALDTTGTDTILVPYPAQAHGLFAALRDRLEKASRSV